MLVLLSTTRRIVSGATWLSGQGDWSHGQGCSSTDGSRKCAGWRMEIPWPSGQGGRSQQRKQSSQFLVSPTCLRGCD